MKLIKLGFGAYDLSSYVFVDRARITLPHFAEVVDDADGSVRVVATEMIPAKTKLGPYEAKKTTQVIEAEDGFILRVSSLALLYVPLWVPCFRAPRVLV